MVTIDLQPIKFSIVLSNGRSISTHGPYNAWFGHVLVSLQTIAYRREASVQTDDTSYARLNLTVDQKVKN